MTDETDIPTSDTERVHVAEAMRERRDLLVNDVWAVLASGMDLQLEPTTWVKVTTQLLDLLTQAVEKGDLDTRERGISDLLRLSPALSDARHLFGAVYVCERTVLDELALHESLGATSEVWPLVAQSVRRASFDLLAAFFQASASRPAPRWISDPLTMLVVRSVFDVALAQEVHRAQRHQFPLSLILLDIDNLSGINETYGHGVGDRVLERMGVLIRRFFRKHDWVGRHGDDSFVVLLPQTALAFAADLAGRLLGIVEQRLFFAGDTTDRKVGVTVSAGVVGTDVLESQIDPSHIIAEAEAAVRRAKNNGRGRIERVGLLQPSVSLIGASRLLNVAPLVVRRLIREGHLSVRRLDSHYHIDRASLERYRMEYMGRENPTS